MKIPDYLKIGGHKVKIDKNYMFREIDNNLGLSLLLEDKILLGSQSQGIPLSDTTNCVNLMHEIFHWIDFVYLGKKLSEDEVKVLAEGFFQVLRDNELDFR
jgi:hypothetical protein